MTAFGFNLADGLGGLGTAADLGSAAGAIAMSFFGVNALREVDAVVVRDGFCVAVALDCAEFVNRCIVSSRADLVDAVAVRDGFRGVVAEFVNRCIVSCQRIFFVTEEMPLPLPLLMGLLVPVSTFFNLQSITVPDWLYGSPIPPPPEPLSPIWHNATSFKQASDPINIIHPTVVLTISWISFFFGVLATGALFFRMLEKKIKWTTRLTILGAFLQGIISLSLVLAFVIGALYRGPDISLKYTEGIFYSSAAAITSLAAAGIGQYQVYLNRNQNYEWTLHQLSPSQRQVTLLTIMSLLYTVMGGFIYGGLEGWDFDDSVYWAVVTLTTIGFGDLYPRTLLGRILVPPFASVGIVLVGFNIYAVREVVLELLTFQLAANFSRTFGMKNESSSSYDLTEDEGANADTYGGDDYSYASDNDVHYRTGHRRMRSRSWDGHSNPERESTYQHEGVSDYGDEMDYSGGFGGSHRLSRGHTTGSIDVALRRPAPRTMTLSRGSRLPQLTIMGDSTLRRRMVVDATQQTFRRQIIGATIANATSRLIERRVDRYEKKAKLKRMYREDYNRLSKYASKAEDESPGDSDIDENFFPAGSSTGRPQVESPIAQATAGSPLDIPAENLALDGSSSTDAAVPIPSDSRHPTRYGSTSSVSSRSMSRSATGIIRVTPAAKPKMLRGLMRAATLSTSLPLSRSRNIETESPISPQPRMSTASGSRSYISSESMSRRERRGIGLSDDERDILSDDENDGGAFQTRSVNSSGSMRVRVFSAKTSRNSISERTPFLPPA
ncbi:Potassium channel [Chytridiales sp. JEL 0842]|nr:Potassium channel [Chytridiales sp. JEL 0842]